MKRVLITFSEPLDLPAAPGASLVFKRGADEVATGRIVIAGFEKTGLTFCLQPA